MRKREKGKVFSKRVFLNKTDGMASAGMFVTKYSMSLAISDCNRIVNLHESFDTREQRENALFKLRELSQLCQKGIEAIEKMVPVEQYTKDGGRKDDQH